MPTKRPQRPIPTSRINDTAEYRTIPVDLASKHNAEPLVSVEDFGVASDPYYWRSDGTNPPYYRRLPGSDPVVRVRASVARRLAAVNRRLMPHDVELVALDGFRSLTCQRALWSHFMRQARRAAPGIPLARLERSVLRYVSDPRRFSADDPRTWPTHLTGAAVDVTLRTRSTRELVFMGGVFDDASAISHTARYERTDPHNSLSSILARQNRRLLYWAMMAEDFVNLPTEWWHFDWGTQLWALSRRARHRRVRALYGPAAAGFEENPGVIA
ncbi:MAG: M15 family metallopeptidase [Vicinamibacterales bacterium]